MPVPLLDVNAQNLPLQEELKAAFDRVLQSGRFIMGEEMEAFEREVAEMVGAKHAISVSSGTDALLLALMALGIGEGDEVLCPSFTFFATAGCIARTGAIPVFVDSCPVDFNIDLLDAATKLTSKTKAIMPVHLFGQAADMDEIMAFAEQNGLKVIEDGAQAIGAKYKGRGVGSIGDFGAYSFFPSKNLGGFGDAGMLVTNNDALAEMALMLRNHGMNPKYYHKYIGGNFRCDALQAALLRVKLREYDRYTTNRQTNASYYTEKLLQLPGVTQQIPPITAALISKIRASLKPMPSSFYLYRMTTTSTSGINSPSVS
ncbi:DegT/DnrJ/EryC1/StrS family aminotransferase [Rubritalea profundi]|uniref:DegT/DnrJ/EryC1/StrS family aminotransferase n=1 Tax=Rubritalea profundi TaxID=1658618 RepID=UPI0026B4F9DA